VGEYNKFSLCAIFLTQRSFAISVAAELARLKNRQPQTVLAIPAYGGATEITQAALLKIARSDNLSYSPQKVIGYSALFFRIS